MTAGAFGENFTVGKASEKTVYLGDRYQVGEVIVQVSQPRQPCWKLARRWQVKNLTALVQENAKTGWYFRVLKAGTLEAPAQIHLLDRPNEQWTIEACNKVFYSKEKNLSKIRALASCSELSEAWKNSLLKKL